MTILTLERFYGLIGLILFGVAASIVHDRGHARRWRSAAFWALLATTFLLGKELSTRVVALLVLAMVALAATHGVVPGTEREVPKEVRRERAARLGNRLFWPTLIIPATAVLGTLFLGRAELGGVRLVDPAQVTLVSLGLGAILALAVAQRLTRAPLHGPLVEGSRLVQTIGWALLLPQMLAALGGIFAKAGVGPVVADLVARALPTQHPFVAVASYCLGMLVFTLILGNAFAAFPVITVGIGLPLVVQQHGGNPAILAAIGMLSGFCGTLMTPMAANFNVVPAMLLDLKDQNAVIRAQLPAAVTIFLVNVALMYVCVYRF